MVTQRTAFKQLVEAVRKYDIVTNTSTNSQEAAVLQNEVRAEIIAAAMLMAASFKPYKDNGTPDL